MPSYPQNRAQAQTAVHDNVEDVEMDNRSKSKKGDVRIQEKEASSNESPAMTIAEVPDGGLKAWLVVAGVRHGVDCTAHVFLLMMLNYAVHVCDDFVVSRSFT